MRALLVLNLIKREPRPRIAPKKPKQGLGVQNNEKPLTDGFRVPETHAAAQKVKERSEI